MTHPAPYNKKLIPIFDRILQTHCKSRYPRILDPFAGVGRIYHLSTPGQITAIDIEQWQDADPRVIRGNALNLNYDRQTFDAVITSPTYGNRMADSFTDNQPEKDYRRNTYTHRLGRKLHAQNSGGIQWGSTYREFHQLAWAEVARVLVEDGLFILNIKDHVRDGKRQRVSRWHYDTILARGFTPIQIVPVKCPGIRHGANRNRISYELVIAFRRK